MFERLPPFAEVLSAWYEEHKRPLPWRDTGDPYHVWLSEIMLQQTRIEAVKPYYTRFLAAAPTVAALAALPDDRLMKLWEGLGYYSRARNLKKAACLLCEKYGGALPPDHGALLALPGVGEYTAGAIASIAFGLPYPAVDGNVLRVLTRLLGDESDVLHPATKKRLTGLLSSLYETASSPASLTQGLMELGETVCAPGRLPDCESCPLSSFCRARVDGSYTRIPYRAPKKARKILYKLVLILHDGAGHYAIRRRAEDGLLAGLYELPQIDLADEYAGEEALDTLARDFCTEHGLRPEESAAAPDARHVFTHLEWHMRGRYLNVAVRGDTKDLLFVDASDLRKDYALPSAFRAYTRFLHEGR